MADIVASVLQKASEEQSKLKSTAVNKVLELIIDEGNLLASDPNQLDQSAFRNAREEFMLNLARDNTQLLINSIWNLPTERVEETIVVELPDLTTILPREKPIPAAVKLTKWKEYAKLKGIQKTKKSRKVWDAALKEYRPRWGYKSAKNEKDWVLEVPQTSDIYEDQFEKKTKAKKERVAKNELHRLRNIARRSKGKVPGVGITPTTSSTPDKDHLQHALTAARTSDASLGRFSQRVNKEEKYSAKGSKKRKFESNIGDFADERKKSLKILSSVTGKNPTLNVQKATGRHMALEEQQRRGSKPKGGKGGKGDKKGNKKAMTDKKNSKKSPYAGKSTQYKNSSKGGKPANAAMNKRKK